MRRFTRALSGLGLGTALVLGMGGVALAADSPIPTDTYTLDIVWKTRQHTTYNPDLKGNWIKFEIDCMVKGIPEGGTQEEYIDWSKDFTLDLQVGVDAAKTIEYPTQQVKNGKTYNNVRLLQCSPEFSNVTTARTRIFSSPSSGHFENNRQSMEIYQQANTDFKFDLVAGTREGYQYKGVIDPKDVPNLIVGLDLEKDGVREPFTRNKEHVAETYVFKDGARHYPVIEAVWSEPKPRFTRFHDAIENDALATRSPYTGKYKNFYLTTVFADSQTDSYKNGKYFIEGIDGNDETGWVVKLSSTVQEAIPAAPTFEESTQCGVPGKVIQPATAGPDADNPNPFEYTVIYNKNIGDDGYVAGTRSITVTASIPEELQDRYILKPGAQTTWEFTENIDPKACELELPTVRPVKPTVEPAETCGVEGTVTIPESKNFDYTQTNKGSTVTVTASLKEDLKNVYKVADDAVLSWELDVAASPCEIGPATPIVTPEKPVFVNPSSSDPGSCDVQPYVEIQKTEGVDYSVTVDGEKLAADDEGRFVYNYGETVVVIASPQDGYELAENAKTVWSWTAQLSEQCTTVDDPVDPGVDDPVDPDVNDPVTPNNGGSGSPLADTGSDVLMLGVIGTLLVAGGGIFLVRSRKQS